MEKINVLGVGISVLSLDSAVAAILEKIREGGKGYVCVTGVHGVIEAQDDPEFRSILNHAFLCTPDGMPTVWIGKYHYGKHLMTRVYGPDLMWGIFHAAEDQGVGHYFYGGKPGVAEILKERMLAHFPRAHIAGTRCPPFRPLTQEEEQDAIEEINRAKPDIVWVGLSTPKQERFMHRFLDRLDAKVMIGVGAAFDFHTGAVPQAPDWIQKSGLEWLFRTCQEPRRLVRRYLRNNPRFLWRAGGQVLGIRQYELEI